MQHPNKSQILAQNRHNRPKYDEREALELLTSHRLSALIVAAIVVIEPFLFFLIGSFFIAKADATNSHLINWTDLLSSTPLPLFCGLGIIILIESLTSIIFYFRTRRQRFLLLSIFVAIALLVSLFCIRFVQIQNWQTILDNSAWSTTTTEITTE